MENNKKTSFHKFMESKAINVELGLADEIEANQSKLDSMFKEGLKVYEKAASKLKSDVNAHIKPMVQMRSKLYNDVIDFKKQYKELVGKDASSDVPFVKETEKLIGRVDVQIDDLTKKLAAIG